MWTINWLSKDLAFPGPMQKIRDNRTQRIISPGPAELVRASVRQPRKGAAHRQVSWAPSLPRPPVPRPCTAQRPAVTAQPDLSLVVKAPHAAAPTNLSLLSPSPVRTVSEMSSPLHGLRLPALKVLLFPLSQSVSCPPS